MQFDPYYVWLGIRDPRRPPHHYRLLGLEPFETDREVIAGAVDRQSSHVRSFLNSPEAFFCQGLLSELQAARICLLDPQRKAAYDEALRRELAAAPQPAPRSGAAPSPVHPALAAAPQTQRPQTATATTKAPPSAAAAPQPWSDGDDPDVQFKVRLPIGVVIFAVGVVAMALFAGVRIMLDARAKQAAIAAAAAAQNQTPLTVSPATPVEPAKKTEVAQAAVVLPPAAAASPSDARVQVLRGHTAPVASAAFSPDGRWAISAGEDKTIRWWDLASGEQLGVFADRYSDPITGVVFGRDGRTAISGSADKSVRTWDLDAKSHLKRMREHTAVVNCVALSVDGQFALSGSADGTVRVWNVKQGQLEKTLTGHTSPVNAIAVGADGRRAASGGGDAQLCLWDLEGGTDPISTIETVDRVTAVAISPDGTELVWGGASGMLARISLATGEELDTFLGHNARIRGVAFVDDYRVASASEDGSLRLWSRTTGEELERFVLAGAALRSLSVAADGARLLTAASDSAVHVWKVQPLPTLEPERLIVNLPQETVEEPGQLRNVKAHTSPVLDVAFSPSGKRFATAGADGTVRLFDTLEKPAEPPTDKPAAPAKTEPAKTEPTKAETPLPKPPVDRITIGRQPVRSVQFSPDGKLILAAGGEPGRVGLWSVETGELVREFAGHQESPVTWARFTQAAEGPLLVLSSDVDRAVYLWDAESAGERKRLIGAGFGDRWAFAAQTGAAVSAGYDRTLRGWDFEFGREVQRLTLPEGSWTERLAISRDGARVLTAGADRVLHLFDLAQGRETHRLLGHTGRIAALAFSADGTRAIAGGTDLRLWDLASGKTAYEFPGQPDPVESATFSANGKLALTGDRSGAVRLWQLPAAEPLAPDPAAVVAAAKERVALPPADALDEATKGVNREFLANSAGLTAADKSALAGQMIVAALGEEANPARRYALLLAGRDMAAQAGDMPVATEAIEALAGEFEVDPAVLRGEAVVLASKSSRTEDSLTLASAAMLGADRALGRFDFDLAAKLYGVVPALSRKVGGPPLATLGAQRTQRLKSLKTTFDKLELAAALEALGRDPADADANLAVGRFLVGESRDLPQALPRLALASDAKWRRAAQAALAGPGDANGQMELAVDFAELASRAKTANDRIAAQELLGQAYVWGSRGLATAPDDAARVANTNLVKGWLAELFPAKAISLAQLPPESFSVGPGAPGTGSIGTGGLLGYEAQQGVALAVFKGGLVTDSISMHPGTTGTARVRYRLFKQFGQFRGTVAIADTASLAPLAAPVVFRVTADGQEVFRSENHEVAGESQEFVTDVSGADVVELSVSVNGSNLGAHALWVEPKLYKKVTETK